MNFAFNTPFDAQLAFFRQKLNLPTERWDDIMKAAHDRAFVVAGAMKADLLDDLKRAVDKSIEHGFGLAEFERDFKQIVHNSGWSGWTGQGTKAGEAWRTKVIYQTNMMTSYAAGRYAQLTDPEFVKLAPYWRYVHDDSVRHPRPEHQAWGDAGLTLRWDDPFWSTHFPPNGWGCMCRVTPVQEPAAGAATEAPAGWDQRDADGNLPGVDKGFDYQPGANTQTPMQDFIDQKLINLDAPIGAALWQALAPTLSMERELKWWNTLDGWLSDKFPRGHTAVVGALDSKILDWLAVHEKPEPSSAEIAIADNLPKGAKQLRHEAAQNGLMLEEWRALPALLGESSSVYFDHKSQKLIFVADGIGPSKAALEFNPIKTRNSGMNKIETAFRVSAEDVAGAIKGGEWTQIR